MDYAEYQHLAFERRDHGVLVVWLNRPEALNAVNERLHHELVEIWATVADDPLTRVVVIAGRGRAFSAGGDLDVVEANASDPRRLLGALRASTELVRRLVELDKPVISAVHGVAIGVGLGVALLADISVVAENARLVDGHTAVGLVAGDHAALVWPLACGLPKARYYLLTSEALSGREAERIGLVSLAVPQDQVHEKAFAVADRLARGSADAIRLTRRALQQWMRQAGPLFEHSTALEMLTFLGEDVKEGVRALREKRAPSFPSVLP